MTESLSSGQLNLAEGNLLSSDKFLREVAYLHYEKGETQDAIARRKNCARQTIGKALQKAKDRGIVRIVLVPEERRGYLQNLARDIRDELGLDDLILVPGHKLTRDEDEDILAAITTAAADYLDGLLANGDTLVVSGGRRIMRNVVRYLKPTKLLPELTVIPALGFIRPHPSPANANLIAYDIAAAYGAQHSWLPVPAAVESEEQRDLARALPVVRQVLAQAEQANIVMLGLWPPLEEGLAELEEALHPAEPGRLEKRQRLLSQAVTHIDFWAFDREGRCLNDDPETRPFYLTGFPLPSLAQKVQQRKVKSILVAGGSLNQIEGIKAVLKAGIAGILITDHITAEVLLSEIRKDF